MNYLFLLLIFFAISISAQTHRFIYEFQYKSDSTAIDFEKDNMALDINPEDVKFYPYIQVEKDSINKKFGKNAMFWDDVLPTITRKRNTFQNTQYFNLDSYFKIDSKDEMIWKLSSEAKKSGDYLLQKATTNFGGRNWIAWFNPSIIINEGPYKFRGLPGLIFEIEDEQHFFKFSLLKSQKLEQTFNTIDVIEKFGGQNAFSIDIEKFKKMQMDNYNDPLRSMREDFKNSRSDETFYVFSVKVERLDQFKDLTEKTQKYMRIENNPIERKFILNFPN